jgi:thiol-disulfide isomerase/thioredoxin
MRRLSYWLISIFLLVTSIAQADLPIRSSDSSTLNSAVSLQSFELGRFEQIVSDKNKQDHLVILWSFDCPPCIKELGEISELHQQFPDYQLTLINTDAVDEQVRVKKILQQFNLAGLDNWGFDNSDGEKLRYDIDPRWFGDLPRSYFFPLQGKIKRLRGALSLAELLALFQPS